MIRTFPNLQLPCKKYGQTRPIASCTVGATTEDIGDEADTVDATTLTGRDDVREEIDEDDDLAVGLTGSADSADEFST
jgi:hypothetical protein